MPRVGLKRGEGQIPKVSSVSRRDEMDHRENSKLTFLDVVPPLILPALLHSSLLALPPDQVLDPVPHVLRPRLRHALLVVVCPFNHLLRVSAIESENEDIS
jgi:hypothetical protein